MCMDNEPKTPNKRITVMGIGGGGQNIINRLYEKLADKTNLNLVCVNTDKQLLECAKANKLLIGEKRQEGIGCGGRPEYGKKAAEESRTEIIKEISGSDMLFIITCLGGGTGTGASSVIAQIAQELGIETKVLATLPFSFEGKKRSLQAMEGIEELKEYAQVKTYNNDDILEQVEGKMSLAEAFKVIDEVIGENIINNLIKEHKHTNENQNNEFIFDYVGIYDDYTVISINNKKAVIDNEFNCKIKSEYDDIIPLNIRLFKIQKNNKWGVIDENGSIIIPLDYDYMLYNPDINDKLLVVKQAEKFGIIDNKNNTVVKFEYDFIWSADFISFMALKNNKFGVIDQNNEIIIPFIYDSIEQYDEFFVVSQLTHEIKCDRLGIKTEDKTLYGIINSKNEFILPLIYDSVEQSTKNKKLLVARKDNEEMTFGVFKNIIVKQKSGKYSILQKDGSPVHFKGL